MPQLFSGPEHTPIIIPILTDTTIFTLPSASGVEPPNGSSRIKADLSKFTTARIEYVSSLASIEISCNVEYSLDQSIWSSLLSNITSQGANILSVGNYESLPKAAKTDVFLRALVFGNGLLSPSIGKIVIQAK